MILVNVLELIAKDVISSKFVSRRKRRMKRKWTKQSATNYVEKIDKTKGIKGLTYWSAMDYLKHHRTMHSIIGV